MDVAGGSDPGGWIRDAQLVGGGCRCRLGCHLGDTARRRCRTTRREHPLRGCRFRLRLRLGDRLGDRLRLRLGLRLRDHLADEPVLRSPTAHTVALGFDDSGRVALDPDAEDLAEVQDLLVLHPQFARQLVHADVLRHGVVDVLFLVVWSERPGNQTHRADGRRYRLSGPFTRRTTGQPPASHRIPADRSTHRVRRTGGPRSLRGECPHGETARKHAPVSLHRHSRRWDTTRHRDRDDRHR